MSGVVRVPCPYEICGGDCFCYAALEWAHSWAIPDVLYVRRRTGRRNLFSLSRGMEKSGSAAERLC